ncbi:hypothetical protein Tco_0233330 [Tanacetum coccineum]
MGYHFYNPYENKVSVARHAGSFEKVSNVQEASGSLTLLKTSGSIVASEKYCDDEKFFELHQKYVEVFKNPIEFSYYEHSDGIDHEDDDGDDDDDGGNGNDNC